MSAFVSGKLWNLSDEFSWIAGDDDIVGHIFNNYAAGADNGICPDGDPAHDGRVRPDGSPFFDKRWNDLPILIPLNQTGFIGCPREFIVDKHHAMADKDFVFDGDAFADEGVALNLAAFADKGVFLNLNKGAYSGFIVDSAAVKIDEIVEDDVFA